MTGNTSDFVPLSEHIAEMREYLRTDDGHCHPIRAIFKVRQWPEVKELELDDSAQDIAYDINTYPSDVLDLLDLLEQRSSLASDKAES